MTTKERSNTLAAALKSVPFLANLTEKQLGEVASDGTVHSLDAWQVVFREGSPADKMYVIHTGQARIYKEDRHGNEVDLARLSTGDFFGEMALLDGGLRSASAATISPCTFFTLERPAFLRTVAKSTELLAHLMTELTSRIRESSDKIFRQELAAREIQAETELQRHRALSQMVAGIAHEVNTPLGIARTATNVIRSSLSRNPNEAIAPGNSPAPAAADPLEALDLLERNILRAHELVQDFKKVSVGQITDTKERLNLSEVLNEIISLYTIEAKSANLEIRIIDELGDASPVWLGYRGYLTQVLMNLLTNVARYAYVEGSGGEVEVSVGTEDGTKEPHFRVSVRDFGVGMPPDDAEKVFEPFFTTGRGRGGTGLGMAIVHNIVTSALRGTIRLDSKYGEGTSVSVTFPQEIPE